MDCHHISPELRKKKAKSSRYPATYRHLSFFAYPAAGSCLGDEVRRYSRDVSVDVNKATLSVVVLIVDDRPYKKDYSVELGNMVLNRVYRIPILRDERCSM